MKYITGLYALNLPCSLNTSGDWHTSALNWDKIQFAESDMSIFEDYGIEITDKVPEHSDTFYSANHLRAILDLLSQKRFDILGDFKNDFICVDDYTNELFNKVSLLLPDKDIDTFMHKIYGMEWRKWIGENNTKKL